MGKWRPLDETHDHDCRTAVEFGGARTNLQGCLERRAEALATRFGDGLRRAGRWRCLRPPSGRATGLPIRKIPAMYGGPALEFQPPRAAAGRRRAGPL